MKAKQMTLMLAVLFLTIPVQGILAQEKDRKDWQDKWKAEKVAYLTDAIGLTSSEAERFWPVYNKCENEKNQCFRLSMEACKALDEAVSSGKGDAEVKSLLDKYIEALDSGKGIEKKYVAEYRKILSDKKVAKLFLAEESFRRQQIHKLHRNDNKGERK